MGNKHGTHGALHEDGKIAAAKFDLDELEVLKRTWVDLTERSMSEKGVNKETFLQYMPLAGLLGDRLFDVFDVNSDGFIDFDEFVCGLAQMGRGTLDTKIEFLFNMCDVDHCKTIGKDQLTTLLNQIPTDVLHKDGVHFHAADLYHQQQLNSHGFGGNNGPSASSSFNTDRELPLSGESDHSDDDTASTESASKESTGSNYNGEQPNNRHNSRNHYYDDEYEEVDNYTNHDIIEKAFIECDVRHEGRLDYEEFKMWVERTPQIIDYIERNMAYAGMVKNPNGQAHLHKRETLPLMQKRLSTLRKNIGSVSHTSLSEMEHHLQHGHSYGGNSPAIASSSKGSGNSSMLGGFVRSIGRKLSMARSNSDAHPPSLSRESSVGSLPAGSYPNTPRQEHSKSQLQQAPTYTISVSTANEHGQSFHFQPLQKTNSFVEGDGTNPSEAARRGLEKRDSDTWDEDASTSGGGQTQTLSAHEYTRLLLSQALSVCPPGNPQLRQNIASLIEGMDTDMLLSGDNSNCPQEVAPLEGYLWKKGGTLHLWSKRYYVISGNCMYYYANKEDVRVKGVVFLEGSNICRISAKDEKELEIQGYFGFELAHMNMCTGEHHRHDKRVLYCRSEAERDAWVHALQREAHVVPISDEYVFGRELGRGRFSVVQECVHKVSGHHAAVKIIDKSTVTTDEKALLRTEIAVLKLVKHPNIIKMLGLYESKDHIYIVMEMLKGGELFERIVGRPRFSEYEAAKLLRPLIEAVAYLHDLGIVHRDLKPENILCGEELEDLKIADFGLSKMILPTEKMDAACGTLSYVAPEVLTAQGYGKEADLWSVGVILFLLLCGKLPFDGSDTKEIIRSTIQGDFKVSPAVWTKLSEDARGLLTSLLAKNPKERVTARAALRHPFLTHLLPARRNSISSMGPPAQSIPHSPSPSPPSPPPHEPQQNPSTGIKSSSASPPTAAGTESPSANASSIGSSPSAASTKGKDVPAPSAAAAAPSPPKEKAIAPVPTLLPTI